VTESVRTVTDVPVFTAESNTLMWQTYLAGAQADGYISPARMADVSGLPPTYVMAAQHDPLRDEALDYARRLVSASVEVDLRLVSAAYHGFDAVVPAAAISLRESNAYIEALARALGSRRWD
jgi:acetyl esterase/lipase